MTGAEDIWCVFRLVDDWLVVSSSESAAKNFVRQLADSNPEYGCGEGVAPCPSSFLVINVEKCVTNFPVRVRGMHMR